MMIQNQSRQTSFPKAVSSPVLTSEDRFLIDLLVDGELDELRRKELLQRLELIPNGWRTCAVAFLENQCWSESLQTLREKTADRKAADISAVPDPLRGKIPYTDGESPSILVQKGDSDAESYIIPLRGGRRRRLIPPKARRSFWTATAGGFLLALALTAGFGFLYWVAGGPLPMRKEAEIASQIPAGSSSALQPSAASALTDRSQAGIDSAPVNQTVQTPVIPRQGGASGKWAAPIRRVTLKSSSNDLDGISVPCVESDRLDPALLTDSTAGQMADRLRKDGHQVETVSEQMMFPLEDGRVLIVPVDTINVRYKETEKEIPVYYQ